MSKVFLLGKTFTSFLGIQLKTSNLMKFSSVAIGSNSNVFDKQLNFVPTCISNKHIKLIQKNGSPLTASHIKTISISSPMKMSSTDHTALWTTERLLSISLLATLPMTIAYPCPALDYVAAISIITHQYWGVKACLEEYVRPVIFGNVIPKLSIIIFQILTIITLGGVINFIYNDIGIGCGVRKLWCIHSPQEDKPKD